MWNEGQRRKAEAEGTPIQRSGKLRRGNRRLDQLANKVNWFRQPPEAKKMEENWGSNWSNRRERNTEDSQPHPEPTAVFFCPLN